jgi:Sulfotransferase family
VNKNYVYDSGPVVWRQVVPRDAGRPAPNIEDVPGTEPTPDARGPMPVVVGCPRSGTTLLAVMLDSHPQIAMPPETAFLPELRLLTAKESAALRRDFFLLLTTDRWGVSNWNDIGIDKDAYWRKLCALRDFSVTGGLRLLYGMYADRLDKRLFGEKTPADTACMPQIEAYLPEARFIHIIRDPRDVVLSLRRTSVGRSFEETSQIWVDYVSSARASATQVGHYHEVRYEDLVLNPDGELRRICNFLELDYSSQMLEYRSSGARHIGHLRDRPVPGGTVVPHEMRAALHENLTKPPKEDRVGSWRREMDPRDRATVEAVAAPLMKEVDYDIPVD